MTPLEWSKLATNVGIPLALLGVMLYYLGKHALPKVLTTMQTQATTFAEQLEKERESARNEAREDRILFREALNQTFIEHKQIVAAMGEMRVDIANLKGNVGAIAASAASAAVSAVDQTRAVNAVTRPQIKEAAGKG